MHISGEFRFRMIQYHIFLWSKNNPSKKYKFIEVENKYLSYVHREFQDIEIEIPMFVGDEQYNNGL